MPQLSQSGTVFFTRTERVASAHPSMPVGSLDCSPEIPESERMPAEVTVHRRGQGDSRYLHGEFGPFRAFALDMPWQQRS